VGQARDRRLLTWSGGAIREQVLGTWSTEGSKGKVSKTKVRLFFAVTMTHHGNLRGNPLPTGLLENSFSCRGKVKAWGTGHDLAG